MLDDGLAATQSLLQLIGKRFSYYGARNAAVAFMAMHRFRRVGTVWSAMGKDVIVYIIAPMLYGTRQDPVWHSADDAGYRQHNDFPGEIADQASRNNDSVGIGLCAVQ